MIILNAIRGERVYLDTNVFIYEIEGYPAFVNALDEFLGSIDARELRAFRGDRTTDKRSDRVSLG